MSTAAYDKYVLENCNRTPIRLKAQTGVIHYNRFTNNPLGRKMMSKMMPQGIQLGAAATGGAMKINMPEPTAHVPYVAPITGARGASMFSTPPPSNVSSLASSYAFETASFSDSGSVSGMSVSSANSLNEKERQRERLYEMHNRGLIGNQELIDAIAAIERDVVVVYEEPEAEPEAEPEVIEEAVDMDVPVIESSPGRGGAREGAGPPSRAEREIRFRTGQEIGAQRREARVAVDEVLENITGELEMDEEGLM